MQKHYLHKLPPSKSKVAEAADVRRHAAANDSSYPAHRLVLNFRHGQERFTIDDSGRTVTTTARSAELTQEERYPIGPLLPFLKEGNVYHRKFLSEHHAIGNVQGGVSGTIDLGCCAIIVSRQDPRLGETDSFHKLAYTSSGHQRGGALFTSYKLQNPVRVFRTSGLKSRFTVIERMDYDNESIDETKQKDKEEGLADPLDGNDDADERVGHPSIPRSPCSECDCNCSDDEDQEEEDDDDVGAEKNQSNAKKAKKKSKKKGKKKSKKKGECCKYRYDGLYRVTHCVPLDDPNGKPPTTRPTKKVCYTFTLERSPFTPTSNQGERTIVVVNFPKQSFMAYLLSNNEKTAKIQWESTKHIVEVDMSKIEYIDLTQSSTSSRPKRTRQNPGGSIHSNWTDSGEDFQKRHRVVKNKEY